MVRLVPAEPRFATPSEKLVWETLRSQLRPEDVLISSLRLTDEDKDHEADFVVLMPDIGVMVVEVKGGSVFHDEHGWHLRAGGETRAIDPVTQVRDAKHAIKRYVENHHLWGSTPRVAWSHGVVAPYSEFDNSFSVPDLPRWALHDRDELEILGERLQENGWGLAHGALAPTASEVELIVNILTGPRTSPDLIAESDDRAGEAERLTSEQFTILKVARLVNRLEIRGGAGSGKTVLALHQARELTRGSGGRKAQRVALICYSIGLAEFLKEQVAQWPYRQRPAFVGTFHELGQSWGAPDGDRSDSAFWESTLPNLMGELARDLPDGKRFDAMVVDEAQDFAESWWSPVLGALKDEETGGLYVFSDENQRIFGRFGRPPVALVPLVLDENLRNTQEIHEAFKPLAPSHMRSRGSRGPEVRYVACEPGEALERADDEVEALLEEGWAPGHVALITTGHRHPEQISRTDLHGQRGYWRTWWDDDVFYGHVLGCKGLERRAVVLAINESRLHDRSKERLYVGMSRATDELVVVGPPELIREMGGDEVARKLGIC